MATLEIIKERAAKEPGNLTEDALSLYEKALEKQDATDVVCGTVAEAVRIVSILDAQNLPAYYLTETTISVARTYSLLLDHEERR